MPNTNTIIAYPNRALEAVLTGPAWVATLPLANLLHQVIQRKARTVGTALANTWFDAALVKARTLKVFSLIAHNLGLTARYRLRGSNTAGDFDAPLYDSGWLDVWPVMFPFGTVEWEDDNWWDGRMLEEERVGYNWNLIHVFDVPVTAMYWRCEIDDTGNTDGFIDIGLLFMAGQWQPVYNRSWGSSIVYEPRTRVDEALSGTEYFDERPAPRVRQFALDHMPRDEAFTRALDLQRTHGISKPVLYIDDPADAANMMRLSFLGRIRKLSPIVSQSLNQHRTGYEIKEVL